jgi:hypothetical protein
MIMAHFSPHGIIVEFEPTGPWRWVQFDGCLQVSATLQRMRHHGDSILIDADILNLGPLLVGKQYAADDFDDVPGAVTDAALVIQEATLFARALIEGHKVVCSTTTGTFRVQVLPSVKSGTPPVPDPQPAHQGTWRIRPLGEPRTQG